MAAEVLLISIKRLKELTALGGNVDSDYVVQFIKIAQDKNILPVLGTKLMDKLKELINDDSLSEAGNIKYLELWQKIELALAHFTMVEYIPFNTYKLKNAGTVQHSPENAVGVTLAEMTDLVDRERDTAENYLSRVDAYLCANSADIPEYSQNASGDVFPIPDTPFHGLTF